MICKSIYIFWKWIQYAIHWNKIHLNKILKKLPSGKINGRKNVLSFLSRALSHHSFTLNLQFLYELKHKVRLSKAVRGIFHFCFRFVFIKVYIFVQQNAWTFILCHNENVIAPFKIKIIEKPHTVLLPDVWFISCNQKFENSIISSGVGAPQNWHGVKFLKLR